MRAIHDAQIAEHGGIAGIRSEALLESAFARPQTLASSDDDADLITIGTMVAIAIARNHPFLDGNERVAWVAMIAFLELNNVRLQYEPAAAVEAMLGLAAGASSDDTFTSWVRDHAAQ